MSGAFTLAIMILPLIIRTTEEALKSVPDAYREGASVWGQEDSARYFALCCRRQFPEFWRALFWPSEEIVGETAALIFTAGTAPVVPKSLFDSARTLSVHMYNLSQEGLYVDQAYATAVVLLLVVVAINGLSNFVAKKIAKDKDAYG